MRDELLYHSLIYLIINY